MDIRARRTHNTTSSLPSSTDQNPQTDNHYDYLFKIILLGPSGAGKSSLLRRFVSDHFSILTSQTIGVEFASKIITLPSSHTSIHVSGPRIKLQLWDTAGTERFRSVSRSYYRAAAGALLVFDLSDTQPMSSLSTFLRDARALAPKVTIILVGNKSDSSSKDNTNDTNDQLCMRWAQENGIQIYKSTSALSGDGVGNVFEILAASIFAKIQLGNVRPEDPLAGIQYGDFGAWTGGEMQSARYDKSATISRIEDRDEFVIEDDRTDNRGGLLAGLGFVGGQGRRSRGGCC